MFSGEDVLGQSTLMAYHLTLVQQHPTMLQHSSPSSAPARPSRPKPNGQKLVEMAKEICLSYNRPSDAHGRTTTGEAVLIDTFVAIASPRSI
jgi:hypothetical protein